VQLEFAVGQFHLPENVPAPDV